MSQALETVVTVNSLSYADLLGVLVGLERLPGETTDLFLDRVHRAASIERGSHYVGLLNEINLQLGLSLYHALTIRSEAVDYAVSLSFQGLALSNTLEDLLIPIVTVGDDGFWAWRKLSEIVADVNASPTFTAELLVGTTAWLCRVNLRVRDAEVRIKLPSGIPSNPRNDH
jgi:hypothetical protein